MSGRHSATRRRNLLPVVAGIAAAAAMIGGAVATVNLGSGSTKTQNAIESADADRSPVDRADRGDRPSPSAVPASGAVPAVETPPAGVAGRTPPSKAPSRKPTTPPPTGSGTSGTCKASFYEDGQQTASGEQFDPDGFTAAHKTLPFNTKVRVTNLANGKSVVVRINDRGPFVSGRCLDLARGAFVTIASVNSGVIVARYEVLK